MFDMDKWEHYLDKHINEVELYLTALQTFKSTVETFRISQEFMREFEYIGGFWLPKKTIDKLSKS